MDKIFDVFPESYIETSKRMIQTPSSVARSTFFYVQETGYLKLKSSHKASRKNLDSYLVVLVLSGSGTLNYREKNYELKKGACFFIDCMTPYYHQSSKENPWELLWVHFHGSSSDKYYHYFSSFSAPVFYPVRFQPFKEKLVSLLNVNEETNILAEISSSRLIVDILSMILEEMVRPPEASEKGAALMLQIGKYLEEHYLEKFSLEELSEQFFLSKYHLAREFKKFYGITPNHYVIAKRIILAKRYLRFSKDTLEEIATKCGFYDASYFNKQFKKSEGISASDFRRKWVN